MSGAAGHGGPGAGAAARSGPSADRTFFRGLARAFGAALFFSLPLLMTMEMWWLGFYADRLRIALFMVLMLPLLVGLSHFSGFRRTTTWGEDAVDAIVAFGVGMVAFDSVGAAPGGWLVEFRAYNAGWITAAGVLVEGELRDGGGTVEKSETTLDYVPARAARRGGLFFTRDPARHRLELRPVGYDRP